MGERSLELRNVGNCMPHDTEQGTSSSTIAPELQTTGREFTSPPADTGKDAWLFLAACWITEILTFGFGLSFGVFQDFYSTHEPFKDSDLIAVVGTTTSLCTWRRLFVSQSAAATHVQFDGSHSSGLSLLPCLW
ncbi:putative Major facilitator superfamily (MFS) profile domain-containing protein [Seiridium cardinale]|uniref:Major facilitator superfamily (MFS) profile domain-containing protein n=1 Tax=Seiridium cardinale TaxID=138064 RepID=A0ABR2XLB7_9PEZI